MRPTTLWLHDPAPDQSGMGCHTGRWESGASQERRSTEAAVRATTAAAAASARERRRFVQPQQAWGGRRELTKLTAQHESAQPRFAAFADDDGDNRDAYHGKHR